MEQTTKGAHSFNTEINEGKLHGIRNVIYFNLQSVILKSMLYLTTLSNVIMVIFQINRHGDNDG